jgi:Transposase
MRMFAALDVGFKRTAVCVVDKAGRIVWRGVVDTHPEALSRALQRWGGKLAKIGLESGSMTPWLVRELAKVGFPTVCMDARAAADAVKSRRMKSDKADAYALAEMLRTADWVVPRGVCEDKPLDAAASCKEPACGDIDSCAAWSVIRAGLPYPIGPSDVVAMTVPAGPRTA